MLIETLISFFTTVSMPLLNVSKLRNTGPICVLRCHYWLYEIALQPRDTYGSRSTEAPLYVGMTEGAQVLMNKHVASLLNKEHITT